MPNVRAGSIIALFIALTISFDISSAPPVFTVCEGLSGVARGLCQAGVAVGCDQDDSSRACNRISKHYQRATGSLPPYAASASVAPLVGTPTLTEFVITDPLRRMAVSDLVLFYLPGEDPADGTTAIGTNISNDGSTLTAIVPSVRPTEQLYLIRVTPDYTMSRFSDLEFYVGCQPPDC